MALPVRQQILYWSIAALVFFVLFWALGNVIVPFLVGMALAYFLDPVADRLEGFGLSRVAATVVISLVTLAIVVLSALLVIPQLVQQATDLIQAIPELFRQFRDFLTERFPDLIDETSPVRQSIAALGETIQARSAELLQTFLTSAAGVLNIVVFLVVVPVVAFYMLLDWDHMIAKIDDLLPRDHQATIRDLARQIDATLAGFIRGQATVCLILGVFYAVALMVVGLNFGLVVGLIAGVLTFIPYVGALVGGALSIGLALFQFWGEWWLIVAVALIFQVGQFVEGNILTPKLVGSSVGLHPVTLIFALSAFGTMFGFAGMLVAVPIAAAIGVLVRFAIAQYKAGLLYQGTSRGQVSGPMDPVAARTPDAATSQDDPGP